MDKNILTKKDIKLVQTLKELVKDLSPLALPLKDDYLIIEDDGCSTRWEQYC